MRYLPLTDADRRNMLASIGVSSVESLFQDVPESVRLADSINLPNHQGELEVERAIAAMASENTRGKRAVFPWGWQLSSPCACNGRSHDSARRVSDLIHAISA